jgi:hypothetical protein
MPWFSKGGGGSGPPGPLADVNLITQANSITAGIVEVTAGTATNYWLPDTSWAAQMCQDALTAHGNFWQLRNFSSPGIITTELIAQVPLNVTPNLVVGRDNVVVLWEIVNEIQQVNPSVATMQAEILGWISDIQAAAASRGIPLSQCRTAIGTCMPSGGFLPAQEANRVALNAWLTGGGSGADIIIDFAGDPRLADFNDTNYFDADKLHLTQNGQIAASQVAFAALLGAPVPQFLTEAVAIWEADNSIVDGGGNVVSVPDASGNGNTLLASVGSVPVVSTPGFNGHKSWDFPGNATLKRVFPAPIPQSFSGYVLCEGPDNPIPVVASMIMGDDPTDYVGLLATPGGIQGQTQNGTGGLGIPINMDTGTQYLISMTWHAAGPSPTMTESIMTVKPALVLSTATPATTAVTGSQSLKTAVIGGFENGGSPEWFWTNRIVAVIICAGSGQGLNRRVWAYLTQKYHFV